MRIIDVVGSANANLWRNKARTFLTILAIFIGAFTINLTAGLNVGVNDYLNRQVGNVGANNLLMVTHKVDTVESVAGVSKWTNSAASNAASLSMGNTSSAIKYITDEDVEKIKAVGDIEKVHKIQMPTIEYIHLGQLEQLPITGEEWSDPVKIKTAEEKVAEARTSAQKQQAEDALNQLKSTLTKTVKQDIPTIGKFVFSNVMAYVDGINFDIAAGNTVSNESSEAEIMLQPEYLEALDGSEIGDADKFIGKTVSVASRNRVTHEVKEFSAKVVGVLNKQLVGGGRSVINQKLADEVREWRNTGVPENMVQGTISAYAVVLGDITEDKINSIKNKLEAAGFEGTSVTDALGIIKTIINAVTYVLIAFAAIALVAAGFGIVNTLLMSVTERTREIGLMKAMGMSGRKIFLLFSLEAIFIGIWGSLAALGASFGVSQIINQVAADSFLKDLPGFNLIEYTIPSVALVSGIIILIAFLAGAAPARKAAGKNPIDALRYE